MKCGGRCCDDAHPPISMNCQQRLITAGVSLTAFETRGYRRLRTNPDHTCILMNDSMCMIHAIKPETCRAGPFTFDVDGDTIRIFLKHASICPIVTLLKEVPEAYGQQYDLAIENITNLVAHLTDAEIDAINRIDEPDTDLVVAIPRGHRFV
ncbi:YkgJ family cysteine cluster protein [Methanoregula sp.]|uniref:YkgJ family cysteine cluster protein n=1 Tax=Methanoregula sp. TaxID=2052170 RepID=UPI0025D81053|nr:YkgJ family cysteine cluster protein [Methanoregula sp.]